MIKISTYEELDNWLKKYHYFEEEYVLKIDMNPLTITIGIVNKGTFEANTEKEILSFDITPINVLTYDCKPDFKQSEDNIIESIDPIEVYEGVGLEIFGPPLLTLIAESFAISENGITKSTFKPWVNKGSVSVKAPMEEIPKPDFWQHEFKKLGFDIVFRCYAGEAESLPKIPSNYAGFFLQLENRVNTTKQGIFIQGCSEGKKEVSMSFQQFDPDLDSLWTALAIILASIPDVTISSGNCKFTGAEWKHQLATL